MKEDIVITKKRVAVVTNDIRKSVQNPEDVKRYAFPGKKYRCNGLARAKPMRMN